eukprot:1920880-Prymnesium_polylepis.1
MRKDRPPHAPQVRAVRGARNDRQLGASPSNRHELERACRISCCARRSTRRVRAIFHAPLSRNGRGTALCRCVRLWRPDDRVRV